VGITAGRDRAVFKAFTQRSRHDAILVTNAVGDEVQRAPLEDNGSRFSAPREYASAHR
jgi:hypothetical protein